MQAIYLLLHMFSAMLCDAGSRSQLVLFGTLWALAYAYSPMQ